MTHTPRLRLDHYNVRTVHLTETITFYRDIVGLKEGPLPSKRPGAWMYDRSDTPVVHITGAVAGNAEAQAVLDAHLGTKDHSTLQGSGAIDHVAFDAPDFEDFRVRLQGHGIAFKEREVPEMSLKQLFIEDPNGITVELNFRAQPSALEQGGTSSATDSSQDAYQGAVAQARALIPSLRASARETQDAGRALDSVVDKLHSAGLFRIVQPKRVGGLELAPMIFFDVCSELAKGCASTSWVLGNIASHHLMLAHWPEQAQQEIWGRSPDILIGSSYVFPAGKAERVAGGYMLSGSWPFSSGIDPCEWVQLGGMVAAQGEQPEEKRYFLLPRQSYEILETWDVAGLAGTGSKDVLVAQVFVPDYRTVSYQDVIRCTSPGLKANPQALFRFPFWAAGGYVLVSSLYGAAVGALEQFSQKARQTAAHSSGQGISSHVTLQQRLARASALLDGVELIVRRRLQDIQQMIETTGEVDPAYGVKARRDAAYCARCCVEAIDLVFDAAGGSALYSSNPLQRAWRDIHAGAANFTLQWDVVGPAYGRVMLGLPSGLPGLPL